jgi:hypothetical protein
VAASGVEVNDDSEVDDRVACSNQTTAARKRMRVANAQRLSR